MDSYKIWSPALVCLYMSRVKQMHMVCFRMLVFTTLQMCSSGFANITSPAQLLIRSCAGNACVTPGATKEFYIIAPRLKKSYAKV